MFSSYMFLLIDDWEDTNPVTYLGCNATYMDMAVMVTACGDTNTKKRPDNIVQV